MLWKWMNKEKKEIRWSKAGWKSEIILKIENRENCISKGKNASGQGGLQHFKRKKVIDGRERTKLWT